MAKININDEIHNLHVNAYLAAYDAAMKTPKIKDAIKSTGYRPLVINNSIKKFNFPKIDFSIHKNYEPEYVDLNTGRVIKKELEYTPDMNIVKLRFEIPKRIIGPIYVNKNGSRVNYAKIDNNCVKLQFENNTNESWIKNKKNTKKKSEITAGGFEDTSEMSAYEYAQSLQN